MCVIFVLERIELNGYLLEFHFR